MQAIKRLAVLLVFSINVACFSPWLIAAPVYTSGFFSTGVTDANRENIALLNHNIENKTNFLADTVFGLQINSSPSELTKFSAQLVAIDKSNSFDVQAEWLYVSHPLSANFEIRAGRMRLSSNLMSETIFVGQSFNWVRPPIEAYSLTGGLTHYNGLSTIYKRNIEDASLEFEFFIGQARDLLDILGTSFVLNTEHAWGAVVKYSSDHVTLKVSNIDTDLTLGVPGLGELINTSILINVVGINYTHGSWGGLLETGRLKASVEGDTRATYLSLYYIVDRFMPMVTFNSSRTDTIYTANPVNGESISVGIRYDFNDTSSVKLQVLNGEVLDGVSLMIAPASPNFGAEVTVTSIIYSLVF